MDLIQEMIVTKREETKKIEEYEEKRLEALDESEKFLSQDIKSFVDFFKRNTQESKATIAEADAMKSIRITETKNAKDAEEDCQKEVSKINKSIESLEEYYKYKVFLDGVSSKSFQNEQNKRNEQLMSSKFGAKSSDHNADKASTSMKKDKHAKRNDFLDEIKCSDDLNKLIDDDNFEYEIEFKNPDDLLKNFTVLEENNLFLIQQTQDAEQALEEKKQEFAKVKKEYEKQINSLQQGLNETNDRIAKINGDMNSEIFGDTDNSVIAQELISSIREKVKKVFNKINNDEK